VCKCMDPYFYALIGPTLVTHVRKRAKMPVFVLQKKFFKHVTNFNPHVYEGGGGGVYIFTRPIYRPNEIDLYNSMSSCLNFDPPRVRSF
jgi:hypothetical protein